MIELARYLHHGTRAVMKFARSRRLLHHSNVVNRRVWWLTPFGAGEVITYIRALQVQWSEKNGREFHLKKRNDARTSQRIRQRLRESRVGADSHPCKL